MRVFTIFIIALAIMGCYDEGNITAAVVMLTVFGPVMFERKKRFVGNKKR